MPKAVASSLLNVSNYDVSHNIIQLKKSVTQNRSLDKTNDVDIENKLDYKLEIIWLNVFKITLLHLMAIYSLCFHFKSVKMATVLFTYFYGTLGGIGITAGAHRLWTHRSYKAKLPLRILLMVMQTIGIQNPIYTWVRDHRVHHKFTDTDADPHNSKRGFFFSHVGWLMVKKHPEVTRRGKGIDMSDILNDPVVTFQTKHFPILALLLGLVVPILLPVYFWGENLKIAFFVTMVRYAGGLNGAWLVNSAAHMWGYKPYDNQMSPTENLSVSFVAYGEGWHNYHHVYPWDYKAAELGNYTFNWTTAFIDFFAWLGLAYDLKGATPEMVEKHAEKNGDGSWIRTDMPNYNDTIIKT